MKLARSLLPALAFCVLAGCASTGGGSSPGAPGSAAAGTSLCTSNACIVSEAQQSAVGLIADDKSVVTKAACRPPTVKRNPGGTWTVTCTVTYSDGKVVRGYANLIPAQDKFTFEPAELLSGAGS